jgi:hypothetical protein
VSQRESAVVPHRFLFRYELAIPRIGGLPRQKGNRPLNLPEAARLADLGALDQVVPFADMRAAWNEHGLGFQVEVTGRQRPLRCDPDRPEASDGFQVWIDTRSTQNVHRATRFCHAFRALPIGGGDDGTSPVAVQIPVARAREDAPLCEPEDLLVSSDVSKTGYCLELWLPAAVLTGFDPAAQPRLGFHYSVRDTERGEQSLSVGADYPYEADPSLWSVLNLVDA